MTVGDLMECLEEFPEDTEVRIMTQPRWPLQFTIRGVVDSDDLSTNEGEELPARVVWIIEGDHPDNPYTPYGHKDAFDLV